MSQTGQSPSALILDMANNQRRSRVDGALDRSARPRDEDTLRFLSPEEEECLQFFEETIGSLENSLEEDELRAELVNSLASGSLLSDEMDGPPETQDLYTAPSITARRLSAKDQDIIDLVRPDPELMLAKLPSFNPTSPDFQRMATNPESHFEIKPRHDPQDHPGSYEPTDGHSYHPAGSVPTPVLIAKKIAENQAVGATNSSALLRRQHSQEGEKSPGHNGDPPTKQGPPTFAKPTRYPANITRILGNKELQNEPVASVNLQDRRALMLSNLTGAPQSLVEEDPKQNLVHKLRNAPTRSISFKDPTPEKTRMEALSKLGLSRNRAMSGGISVPDTGDSTPPSPVSSAETSVTGPLETKFQPTETHIHVPDSKVPMLPQSQTYVQKAENWSFESARSFDYRKPPLSPPHQEKTLATPSQSDIVSLELNSFGGKSIVVTPGPPKNEAVTPPTSPEAKVLPSVLANPSEFNSYGGKSKVLKPATGAMTRGDLPDILSSHIDVNHNFPAKPLPLPAELNSYGGKSRTINPSTGVNRPGAFKGPPPTPAPRNPQSSHPGATPAAATQAPSPSDAKRRSAAMFRPQGITVQFSGRGATEESRKEALKKLGLLKES
ncbi:proline and serine-rich protein 2 [Syngnathoides biaculeatus]|uniref:proline and serine-rich protein 2 n=1 Tax=Syngnathoides biaculeatus TaxID=300417 RepID=UPI002ADE27AE|nr:proline and serine-rich protein 2 [Syngnathoides biaculeatus]